MNLTKSFLVLLLCGLLCMPALQARELSQTKFEITLEEDLSRMLPDGLSQDDLPQNKVSPDGLLKDSLSQNKLLPDDLLKDSLLQDELSQDDLLKDSLLQDGFTLVNDRMLHALIASALQSNNNILQAMDRVMQARSALRIARADFYPSLGVGASWSRGRELSSLPYTNEVDLSLSASWEIDLFGSIRKKVKSQDELYKVSRAERDWVMISISAQVATAYINLRVLQQQQAVTERNVDNQLKMTEITAVRYKTGLASLLDVSQSKGIYASTSSTLPVIKYQILQCVNSIAILLGQTPATVREELMQPGSIPECHEVEEMEIPLEWLLNRPDICAAEYTVRSNAALIGASKADIYPKFYFKGSVGFASDSFDKIFRENKSVFTINPTISWTLFNGSALQESIRQSKAQWEESVSAYNQAVIEAMSEADNAMQSYFAYKEQAAFLTEAVLQEQKALELSIDLYKKGLQNFQSVLDAQRSLLEYENSLVTARGNMVNAVVLLYKAFGGKWL